MTGIEISPEERAIEARIEQLRARLRGVLGRKVAEVEQHYRNKLREYDAIPLEHPNRENFYRHMIGIISLALYILSLN